MAGHAGKRFDRAGVDLIEFGDPVEDAVQLADELFLPVLGNIDPREACLLYTSDAADES